MMMVIKSAPSDNLGFKAEQIYLMSKYDKITFSAKLTEKYKIKKSLQCFTSFFIANYLDSGESITQVIWNILSESNIG